jgi:hypothetical protein
MAIREFGSILAAVALVSLGGCDMLGGGNNANADDKTQAQALVDANAAGGKQVATAAAGPDFGDDNGSFSKDGECDDMRFEGPGMTSTPLLDQDIKHDATDCRAAFNQNRLTFKGDNVTSATLASVNSADVSHIQWGDDNGSFSNDGECDDKRFDGAGMTSTPLLDSDIKHDATDCRVAFQQGRLALRQ